VRNLRQQICERRRHGGLSKDDAEVEWGLARDLERGMSIERWMEETHLSEAYEFIVYDDMPGQLRIFLERIWPLLVTQLRSDLEAEAA